MSVNEIVGMNFGKFIFFKSAREEHPNSEMMVFENDTFYLAPICENNVLLQKWRLYSKAPQFKPKNGVPIRR